MYAWVLHWRAEVNEARRLYGRGSNEEKAALRSYWWILSTYKKEVRRRGEVLNPIVVD